MKIKLQILTAIVLAGIAHGSSVPTHDFSTQEIQKSTEVRKALGVKRFKVVRMNQFMQSARFAAISQECVAIVKASRERISPNPPDPDTPYPDPTHPWPRVAEGAHLVSPVTLPAGNLKSPKRPYPLHPDTILKIHISELTCDGGAQPPVDDEAGETPAFSDSFTESFQDSFTDSFQEMYQE